MVEINLKSEMLCRACLESLSGDVLANDKFDIFQTYNLMEKFEACTGLIAAATDEFPDHLCESCYSKVLDFYQFRIMCKESIERYHKFRTANNLEDVKPIFDYEMESNEHITIINTHMVLTNDCLDMKSNESVKKTRGRPRKVISSTQSDKNSYSNKMKDDDEKSSAESEETDDDEFVLTKKKNSSTKQSRNYSNSQKSFQCDICTKRFVVEHRLVAHKRSHDGLIPYPCTEPGCDKGFKVWHSLNEHQKEHQGSIIWYKCEETGCDKAYKHKPTLNMHMRKCHKQGLEIRSHICEICGKVLKTSAILNAHRFTHKEKSELPFPCKEPECNRSFFNKEKLKEHMLRHAGIKNFVCPHCGIRKTTRHELNAHINYHTRERQFPCRFCTKVCNNAGNLKTHIRTVHECAKDYACSYCDRTFAKPDTRKYHEMTHTGEKPNVCDECGKQFIQPAALRRHSKIHQKNRLQTIAATVNTAEDANAQPEIAATTGADV